MTKDHLIDEFVADLAAALDRAQGHSSALITQRRLLRTVAKQCRTRLSQRFLAALGERLSSNGLSAAPSLDSKGLRGDQWIYFAKGQFPPDAMLFPRERDLVRFISACVGTGAFRDLRLARIKGHGRSDEFRLPNGQRIDLLCEEKSTSGPGALIAIEVKSDGERGVTEQVVGYIDALRELFPDREVRGLIITGREDRVGAKLLPPSDQYHIDWLCYRVEFRAVSDG